MQVAELSDAVWLPVQRENVIRLPVGLLGFETVKEYVLLHNPEEAPFCWLQVVNDPNLAFVVVSPFRVVSDYQADVAAEDVAFLELRGPEEALVLCIVTLRGAEGATVNLKGPVVVNRRTLVGKQVIPVNAGAYGVRHPLPLEA